MSKRDQLAKDLFEVTQKMNKTNTLFTWETVNAGTQLHFMMMADELISRGYGHGKVAP